MKTLIQKLDDLLFKYFESKGHLCSDQTRSEIIDLFLNQRKEWLQQKPTYTKNQLSDDGSDSWLISSEDKYYKKDELLEDLEK